MFGQIGNNQNTASSVPVKVHPGEGLKVDQVTQVSLGLYHTCAIDITGGLYCWGDNYYGQLGINSRDEKTTPVRVKNPYES